MATTLVTTSSTCGPRTVVSGMEQRVAEGVYTAEKVAAIEAEGAFTPRCRAAAAGGTTGWADWQPPAEWQPPKLPADWARRFESK